VQQIRCTVSAMMHLHTISNALSVDSFMPQLHSHLPLRRAMRCTGIPCRSFHAVTVPPPLSPPRCPWVYRRTSGTLGWHATCLIHTPYDAAYHDRVSITVGWMVGCNQRKRVHSSAFCWPPLATAGHWHGRLCACAAHRNLVLCGTGRS
jgi:hypothetical protein